MKQNTISILKSMLLRGDEVYAVKALMNIFMGLVHGWPKLRHRGHDFAGYGLMPHKHNAGKRHHIPKSQFTVTNWSGYENGLKQRGSLTLWITPEAIAEWKAAARVSPGGQPRYSDLAIQACLMVRTDDGLLEGPYRSRSFAGQQTSRRRLPSVWRY
ncbi:hypothetical protein FH428_22490 [Salmonella enterica]|nr:hypothetical protein [Salmonella enterica]EBF4225581.1 hypothetical protein [Salmonella enterica]